MDSNTQEVSEKKSGKSLKPTESEDHPNYEEDKEAIS